MADNTEPTEPGFLVGEEKPEKIVSKKGEVIGFSINAPIFTSREEAEIEAEKIAKKTGVKPKITEKAGRVSRKQVVVEKTQEQIQKELYQRIATEVNATPKEIPGEAAVLTPTDISDMILAMGAAGVTAKAITSVLGAAGAKVSEAEVSNVLERNLPVVSRETIEAGKPAVERLLSKVGATAVGVGGVLTTLFKPGNNTIFKLTEIPQTLLMGVFAAGMLGLTQKAQVDAFYKIVSRNRDLVFRFNDAVKGKRFDEAEELLNEIDKTLDDMADFMRRNQFLIKAYGKEIDFARELSVRQRIVSSLRSEIKKAKGIMALRAQGKDRVRTKADIRQSDSGIIAEAKLALLFEDIGKAEKLLGEITDSNRAKFLKLEIERKKKKIEERNKRKKG